jgi:hypothetical protein
MNIDALSYTEKDTVLRFLLHHLQPELRAKLMARHPIEYVTMAPHTIDTVVGKVASATAERASAALPVTGGH